MKQRWGEMMARRKQGEREREEVERMGWLSLGDLPYEISRSIGKSYNTIMSKMPLFIEEVLRDESEGYEEKNLRKIIRSTYVSPEFAKKIEEKVKLFYQGLEK